MNVKIHLCIKKSGCRAAFFISRFKWTTEIPKVYPFCSKDTFTLSDMLILLIKSA